jgi:hypothetical protein
VDTPVTSDADDDGNNNNIYQEYVRMQQDIVQGRLLCSKEEAATLAAVQLRLEAWPDDNDQPVEPGESSEAARAHVVNVRRSPV